MTLPRPLTDDELRRAQALWSRHKLSTYSIAKILGVHESVVYRYLGFVKSGRLPLRLAASA